jgi:hypothetical protein
MNKLPIEQLHELNKSELFETQGGSIPLLPVGFAIWLGNEIVQNWSDIKSGIKDAIRDGLK